MKDHEDDPMRLDVKLAQMFPTISRNRWQRFISEGVVSVNGCPTTDKDRKLIITDSDKIILLDKNIVKNVENEVGLLEPIKLDLDIIYEDEYLMVVNKPRGLVVHPGAGTSEPTLANGLLYHCGDNLSDLGGNDRPGIVHRIDKDTSGLLMIAKTNSIHEALKKQLSNHSISRVYIALVHGKFNEKTGYIDYPIMRDPKNRIKKIALDRNKQQYLLKCRNENVSSITEYSNFIKSVGAREAYTSYEVISSFKDFSLLRCRLKTGRTHQIRVHMASIGHPIVGDPIYGLKKTPWREDGQMLHAALLGFIHPIREEFLEFSVSPPEDFQAKISKIINRSK